MSSIKKKTMPFSKSLQQLILIQGILYCLLIVAVTE
jgi:hypothetical protein